jgi:hypothetical protein
MGGKRGRDKAWDAVVVVVVVVVFAREEEEAFIPSRGRAARERAAPS